MAVVFVLGILISATAPLLRRLGRAAALAAGAAILIAFCLFSVIHPDHRAGEAAVEANRRFSLIALGCEVPVLTLALISMAWWKRAFWVGWAIHFLFTPWLIVVVVWLEFFWHW